MKSVLVIMFIVVYIEFNKIIIKNKNLKQDVSKSKLFNFLNIISFSFPLSLFLDDSKGLSEKEQKMEKTIKRLNLDNHFSLKGFMALRFSCFFLSIILYVIVVLISKSLMKDSFNLGQTFLWLAAFLFLSFIPDLYLKRKEKEYQNFYYDEVIVLQLFLILLIKSGSTISDILFSFSKMNTFYKDTFKKAYRISLRNQKEALIFLENKFSDLKFASSFEVLQDLSEYSKEDSLRILGANLKAMEEEINSHQLKTELTKFSYSQISVVVPFLIVVFLGAIPVIKYGVEVMMESIQGI